jgi:hypothetical protein
MKFANFKKIFAFLFIILLLLENPINTKRHLTKSKLKSKTNSKLFFLGLALGSIAYACYKLSDDTLCENPEKHQPKLDALNNDLVEKSKMLVKIIQTRKEFNNLRAHVLEHISQFIGVIPAIYFTTHEEFILNYINCYIDEKVKDPKNSLESKDSSNDDLIVEKFKAKISVLFNPLKNYHQITRGVNYFSANYDLMKHFIDNIFVKFTQCNSPKMTQFLQTQTPEKISEFTNALTKIKNPPENIDVNAYNYPLKKKRKFKRRLNSEKSGNENKNRNGNGDGNGNGNGKIIELSAILDEVNKYSKMAYDVSQTILDASKKITEVIDFIEKPLQKFNEKTGFDISPEKAKIMLDHIGWNEDKTKLGQLKNLIIKSKSLSEKHLQTIKNIQEKYIPYVGNFNSAALKVTDFTGKTSKILKQVAALSVQDKPSIIIAKVLLISANVLEVIPINTPQKTYITKGLKFTGEYIQKSDRLQEIIDTGITEEAKKLQKSSEYGLLPVFAINNDDFAMDTDVNLEVHREAYKRVLKEAVGEQVNDFINSAENGHISKFHRHFSDFGETDLDPALDNHNIRFEEILKYPIEKIREVKQQATNDLYERIHNMDEMKRNFAEKREKMAQFSTNYYNRAGNTVNNIMQPALLDQQRRFNQHEMSASADMFNGFNRK